MRICILQSSYEETNSVFKDVDPYADPARWLKDHDCVQVLIKKATAMQQIRDLAKQNFDVFINLCDGAWDEDRAGLGVVQALEKFNLPYTGASSGFYEPSKELMKMAAYYAGVRTPAFVFAYNDADIEEVRSSAPPRRARTLTPLALVGCKELEVSSHRQTLQRIQQHRHDEGLQVP